MLKIILFDKVSSTNDKAIDILKKNHNTEPSLILAKTQTSGRGRLNGRTWVSENGNFHGTYIINIEKIGVPENSVSALNRAALLGIFDEISKLNSTSSNISIKFPNDILVNGKKISGVLIEVLYPYALIGIGINLCISPIDVSTNIKKEFNLLVDPVELGQNLYMSLLRRIIDANT